MPMVIGEASSLAAGSNATVQGLCSTDDDYYVGMYQYM